MNKVSSHGVPQDIRALEAWGGAIADMLSARDDTPNLYCHDLAAAFRAMAATADRLALHALKEAMRYQRESEEPSDKQEIATTKDVFKVAVPGSDDAV